MNIIIVGCGRVGYILAKHLSEQNHFVTLIDKRAEKLAPVLQTLDVQAVIGNGTTRLSLSEAGVDKANLLIAVTSEDEVNMISSLIAKKVNPKCLTIARIRKPEYLPEVNYLKSAIGISMSINPEYAAAKEIYNLISIPNALDVDSFAKGKVELLKVKVDENSCLNGMKVSEVSKKFNRRVLICIHVRGDEVTIPNGNTVLLAHDIISVIIPKYFIPEFYNTVGNYSLKHIKNVLIAGGGTTAFYLAEMLTESGIRVKIIEKDKDRCKELCSLLDKTEIINGDAENRDILLENGLEHTDAFVALTTIDEENLFLSLYANKVAPDCKKITRVQKLKKDDIIQSLPVGNLIVPRELTVEYILQHIRALTGAERGSNVEALYNLMDGRVEALEFSLTEESRVLNIPLSELKIKPSILISLIVRGNKLITPQGSDMLKLNDSVIIVTTLKGLNNITDITE